MSSSFHLFQQQLRVGTARLESESANLLLFCLALLVCTTCNVHVEWFGTASLVLACCVLCVVEHKKLLHQRWCVQLLNVFLSLLFGTTLYCLIVSLSGLTHTAVNSIIAVEVAFFTICTIVMLTIACFVRTLCLPDDDDDDDTTPEPVDLEADYKPLVSEGSIN